MCTKMVVFANAEAPQLFTHRNVHQGRDFLYIKKQGAHMQKYVHQDCCFRKSRNTTAFNEKYVHQGRDSQVENMPLDREISLSMPLSWHIHWMS